MSKDKKLKTEIIRLLNGVHAIVENKYFNDGRNNSAYLVGGFVRDLFLERDSIDVDILVLNNVRVVAKELADRFGGSFVILDSVHDAYRVVFTTYGISVDIVAPKCKQAKLEADLRKRDFTINALAIPLQALKEAQSTTKTKPATGTQPTNETQLTADMLMSTLKGKTIDIVDGIKDLQARKVSVVYEAAFEEDALRILRGVRLATQLGFTISDDTKELMRRYKHQVKYASYERIRAEFWAILVEPCSNWLSFLGNEIQLIQELIPEFMPEIMQETDCNMQLGLRRVVEIERSIEAISKVTIGRKTSDYFYSIVAAGYTRLPLLKFAALLSGLDYERARPIINRWKLSSKEASIIKTWLSFDGNIRSFHELYETYQAEAIGAIILQNAISMQERLHIISEYVAYLIKRQQLTQYISGKEIIEEFHVLPGKEVKELLMLLDRLQMDGIITSRESARDYLGRHLNVN
ncbi:CCA tRNA nucleotidyltransferase [Desulfuribacillus alkaliarsenatis]|uniref:Poly A polymerase head domain-containing protein n=1 Tax=Desulfuribacillus alkaliarsenatis TaxID=766136 RepID=A0A1E5G115_9FIRM|nr:CCA tRNA nucleotidyltransferase [Desulfuribacillus alkaliarsenatis]OEF96514.1 hypothetical protein BHF68_07630 [Desulfuribacillus alkaliarsenatis]